VKHILDDIHFVSIKTTPIFWSCVMTHATVDRFSKFFCCHIPKKRLHISFTKLFAFITLLHCLVRFEAGRHSEYFTFQHNGSPAHGARETYDLLKQIYWHCNQGIWHSRLQACIVADGGHFQEFSWRSSTERIRSIIVWATNRNQMGSFYALCMV